MISNIINTQYNTEGLFLAFECILDSPLLGVTIKETHR
jgi:hypothetical protein